MRRRPRGAPQPPPTSPGPPAARAATADAPPTVHALDGGSEGDATCTYSAWVSAVPPGPEHESRRACVQPSGVEIDAAADARAVTAATRTSPAMTPPGV